MKNSNDTIGNGTRALPTCSAVPQPAALPRAPIQQIYYRYADILQIYRYSADVLQIYRYTDLVLSLNIREMKKCIYKDR